MGDVRRNFRAALEAEAADVYSELRLVLQAEAEGVCRGLWVTLDEAGLLGRSRDAHLPTPRAHVTLGG